MSDLIRGGASRATTAHNQSMETARMQQGVPAYAGHVGGMVGSCNAQHQLGTTVYGREHLHGNGSSLSGDVAGRGVHLQNTHVWGSPVHQYPQQQQHQHGVVPLVHVVSDPFARTPLHAYQLQPQQHVHHPQVHIPQHQQVHPLQYQSQQQRPQPQQHQPQQQPQQQQQRQQLPQQQPQQLPQQQPQQLPQQQHPTYHHHNHPHHLSHYAQQHYPQPIHANLHRGASQHPAQNFVKAQRRTSASSEVSSLSDDVDTRLRFGAAAAAAAAALGPQQGSPDGQHLAIPGNDANQPEGVPPTWVVEIPSSGTNDFPNVDDEDLLSIGSLELSSSPPKRDHHPSADQPPPPAASAIPASAANPSPYLSHTAHIHAQQVPLVRSASSSNVVRSRSNPPGKGRAAVAASSRARAKDQSHQDGHKHLTNLSYHGVTNRMRASSASPGARHIRTSTFHSQQGFGDLAGLAMDLHRRTGGDIVRCVHHDPAPLTHGASALNASQNGVVRTYDSNGKRANPSGGGAFSRSPGATTTTATTAGSGSLSSSGREAAPLNRSTSGSSRIGGTTTKQSLTRKPSSPSSRRRDKNGRKGAGLQRATGCFT